jgi:hypothetical protein
VSAHHRKTLLALLIWCVTSALMVFAFCRSRGAIAVVETIPDRAPIVKTLVYDFGRADAGSVHRCEFEVKNDSDTELQLALQGATNHIRLERSVVSLPAGESTVIEAEYRCPSDFKGQYRQRADLVANDPGYDVLELVVTGSVD